MDLLSSLSIATSSLNAIEYQYSVTSQNVANQTTAGYVSETAVVTSAATGSTANGVQIGKTVLNVSQALQNSLYAQNAQVAAYTATSNSLASVSAVQGTTATDSTTDSAGTTATLSDQLGNVQSALTSLVSTPLESSAQSAVIGDAQSLVDTIHTLSSTYTTQRQQAQDNVTSSLSDINSDLTQIGVLSQQIVKLQSVGSDTADLENQRLGLMTSLSSELSVTFTQTPNGDMIVKTANGVQLPTRPDQIGQSDSSQTLPSSTWPLSLSDSSFTSSEISASTYYAANDSGSTIPGIMLNGKDITTSLTGGTLGANITLRDDTYPKMQAQLDSFSYTLINRFNSAGLSLFTNDASSTDASEVTNYLTDVQNGVTASGAYSGSASPTTTTSVDSTTGAVTVTTTPPSGIVGLSSLLGVNAIYSGTPSLLTMSTTDSTTGTTTAATSVAGATKTGDTSVLTNVLGTALGTATSNVSGSLAAPTNNLGPTGTLSTGYTGTEGLLQLSTSLTSDQGATIAAASSSLTSSSSFQTILQTQVSNVSGVNVNDEMAKVVALQNAYTANAKIVSAVQSMFTSLLDAIQ